MTASPPPGKAVDAADWATLWQSELAALAVDRECHEGLFAAAQAWVTAGDAAGGRTRPDAPAGAPAAGAALELELDALRRRVAELERAAKPGA